MSGGKCPEGKCPGGICPWGKCPGVHVRGVYVLEPGVEHFGNLGLVFWTLKWNYFF